MKNLTSLESIDIGQECFGGNYNQYWYHYEYYASSFSLTGEYDYAR